MITETVKISFLRQTVPPIVPAVQGDSGRNILCDLTDYSIPSGATAAFYIQKPSGNAIYNTAEIGSGNNIIVPLDAQCLAEKGENKCQVRILLNGEVITSFMFILLVKPFYGEEAVESTSEMSIFDKAVEEATEQIRDSAEEIAQEVIDSIPADYTALSDDVTDLKADLDSSKVSNGIVSYYEGSYSSSGSSNWPRRSFTGNISQWNGAFGSGGSNYYSDIIKPTVYSTTKSSMEGLLNLETGHVYSVSAYVLSGNVNVDSGQSAEIVLENGVTLPMGETREFAYNGTPFKMYFHFSAGVVMVNAVIAVIVKDITGEAVSGVTQKRLSGYAWGQGKHTTRDNAVETLDTATDTVALMAAIPYDYNMYFVLSEGWKVGFASVGNGVITGTPKAYIDSPGRIDMIDVYNNLTYNTSNVFGDSLTINLRKSDNSAITPNTINIDEAVQMFVVNKKGDSTKSKKWVAIGDSITDGRYSQSDGTVRTKTNHYCQYGYIASKLLGIDTYEEQGYGGMGYVHVANDGTYLTDVLALDFGSPDIITVCLGINDRSQPLGDNSSVSNDGTISGAIKNCCEVLGNKYKNAQIIFFTPINGTSTGTIDTGWCKRSGTTHLSDIADTIKYWANLYGFCVVDLLNESPVNDFNIESMILDALHPTMEAHCMIGHYLAGALPYKTC